MDLGSLELQIFVSLTVVLGGAFVALVCDYLKGNNEQLREHNIELRVRKEEQERRLLLDPAGFLGQWMPGQRQAAARTATAAEPSAVTRAVAPHEVMQSFADPEALADAEDRAAKLHARAGDEPFESADVPPLTQRRNGRNRSNRKASRQVRKEPENYADWVRPEVIAKVARRAQATAAYSSDIREELESLPADALPEPLNAAENWDIRQQLPGVEKGKREQPKRSTPLTAETSVAAEVTTAAVAVIAEPALQQENLAAAAQIPQEEPLPEHLAPEQAVILQKEIERVAQLERRPVVAAPGTILRPLTVPSLKLEEELQRVAEITPASAPVPFTWNSALLDEVIAASGTREVVAPTAVPELVAEPVISLAEPAVAADTVAVPVVVEQAVVSPEVLEEVESVEETPAVAVLAPESVVTAPVAEELVADEIALDHNGYWEQSAGSTVGGSFSDRDQPEVSLPEVASVEFAEVQSPTLDLPADADVLTEVDFAVVTMSAAVDAVVEHVVEQVVEQTDLAPAFVEPLALLAAPVAAVAIADVEPVSSPDLLAVETEIESVAVAEVGEPEADTNLPELTFELPLFPVQSAPVVAETEEQAFVEAFLPAELLQPVQSEPAELEIAAVEPNSDDQPELSPITAEALPDETYVDPPPFVYLIESAAEPVELPEAEPLLPVVFEVAHDGHADETAAVEPVEVESLVEPPPFIFELDSQLSPEPVAELEAVEAERIPVLSAEIIDCYSFWPRQSRLAGMGISPMVDYLQSIPGVETPAVQLSLVAEPALSSIDADSGLESFDDSAELPELLPAYSDLSWDDSAVPLLAEPEVVASIAEPPPMWVAEPEVQPERNQSLPIDISALRQPEPELMAPAPAAIPDLLLPTGMHDISTWTRLMSLPNPMTGILIVISLQPSENRSTLPQPKGTQAPENNSAAIDKFMASFVREGDFGSHISENQWVFIYSNDVAGFNQRRVGMISEKLWDFQLRHLGLANVSFKWGAIDVQSEPMAAALDAARDRMNQTNRARKLPGADSVIPRRVVNG